ncbi:hypothetical protein K491DRAFT_778333 [Lophiostoma macrostomum CBS 122681]|uniref:Uncharacterized protein n=1 Tax=Lophiostoma macrostomum CBS 122681 TaxID=1314788 RepID=A0A6A6TAZ6_9PLEO|nr:hypothetical protein K491DRAFT_778333 [Lophiostoma macrostomum CBS 122681]
MGVGSVAVLRTCQERGEPREVVHIGAWVVGWYGRKSLGVIRLSQTPLLRSSRAPHTPRSQAQCPPSMTSNPLYSFCLCHRAAVSRDPSTLQEHRRLMSSPPQSRTGGANGHASNSHASGRGASNGGVSQESSTITARHSLHEQPAEKADKGSITTSGTEDIVREQPGPGSEISSVPRPESEGMMVLLLPDFAYVATGPLRIVPPIPLNLEALENSSGPSSAARTPMNELPRRFREDIDIRSPTGSTASDFDEYDWDWHTPIA